MPRQVADDIGIHPRDRIELPRPVVAKMRPREPRGFMRLPLGGHAVSPCGWKKPGAGRGWSVHFAVSVRLFSVKHPAGDGSVTVDTPVAQEGPVAANVFQFMKVHFAKQNLFLIVGSFSKNPA